MFINSTLLYENKEKVKMNPMTSNVYKFKKIVI